MISITLEGTLPEVRKDFTDVMTKAEDIMLKSVQMNLMMGGRPAFNTKTSETPLVGTGKMYHGITGTHDSNSATVYMDSSVVSKRGFFYPAALHFGAQIPEVSGKLMVFNLDGHTIFTYHRKGFKLGPFPFMIFQAQDKEQIVKLFADAIFTEPKPIKA